MMPASIPSAMTKISASTFFMKKVFPVVWFGFIAFFVVVTLREGAIAKDAIFLIGPLFMAVVGIVVMKKLIWDLADEVYDCGDSLLVRNGGDEERVLLSNIMNVSASTMTNPPRITLRLVNPGKFGTEIVFSPTRKLTFIPFARNPVAEDLIVRVDKARSKRGL